MERLVPRTGWKESERQAARVRLAGAGAGSESEPLPEEETEEPPPLEEAEPILDDAVMQRLGERERAEGVRAALDALSSEDREIFYRFYDLCQTSGEIAAAMRMNPATVRTRLSRGRETLRRALCSEEEAECSMK